MCIQVVAEPNPKEFNKKIGLNPLSLLVISDFNLNYEHSFSKESVYTWVGSFHFVGAPEEQEVPLDYRISGGVRAYRGNSKLGDFIEGKIGVNGIDGRSLPSVELWIGKSEAFNESVYYDIKAGLIRYFDRAADSEAGDSVYPSLSVGLGVLL